MPGSRFESCLAAAVVAIVVAVGPVRPASPASRLPSEPSLSRLVGQHLMGAFTGTRPSAALLGRVERGRLGGVIVRTVNIDSVSTLRATIAELQAAATRGGQPPLLIAIDQEGGSVKRLRAGPPFASAAKLGADASAAERAGLATGRYLRSVGVNVDLAPVLDVPASSRSFLGSRAFARDPATVARAGVRFAQGLESAGVAATAKHFPGLGTAPASTDGHDVTVKTPRSVLLGRLAPFRAAVDAGVRLVMVGSARYPALDPSRLPALLSPTIVDDLLRRELGFRGVVITDTMGARSVVPFPGASTRAIRSGVDVLLYSANEDASAEAYRVLMAAMQLGELGKVRLRASYDRVLRLKSWLRTA
jgi:beta-N-acetylhexosaminidase